jgi:hypothetical protein
MLGNYVDIFQDLFLERFTHGAAKAAPLHRCKVLRNLLNSVAIQIFVYCGRATMPIPYVKGINRLSSVVLKNIGSSLAALI